jgi:serine/threonine protein kinase/sugar lactone lactonase YvrE
MTRDGCSPSKLARPERIPLGPGSTLGRYQIEAWLGQGGMGTVYQAMHRDLRKRVAIKVLHDDLAADRDAHTRFLREGEAVARIRHAHVVDVSDVDHDQGRPFLVMEYLDGEDLAALLVRQGKLEIEQALEILLPVIAAVGACHDQGVIHRDLKPQNIFLARTADGEVTPKVLDFGVSKLLDPQGQSLNATRAGAVFGSASYMSPEQARAEPSVGAATDQYALGVILYQCLTGQSPWPGDNTFDVLTRVAAGRFERPRRLRPDLPAGLEVVILRAMRPDPARRFADLTALGRALMPFAPPRCQSRLAATFPPLPAAEPLSSHRPARFGLGTLIVLSSLLGVHARPELSEVPVSSRPAWAYGPGCGPETPDISSIRDAVGLAIDRRGVIYFSQQDGERAWIGRLRSGGSTIEPRWVQAPGTGTGGISALAVDSDRHALYVASNSASSLQVIDVGADPPTVRDLVTDGGQVRGLAVDSDGNVHYSQQGDRRIFRVTPEGVRSSVTAEPLLAARGDALKPAGLAFGPDGDLFVGSNLGIFLRLGLEGGQEARRSEFGKLSARGGGLAFDVLGRLYVAEYWRGQRSVFRLEPDGASWTVVTRGSHLGGIAFGRGALDCRDLYIASGAGPLQRIRVDSPGLSVP